MGPTPYPPGGVVKCSGPLTATHPLPDVATISALERELVKVVGIKKGEKLNGVQKERLKVASGLQPVAERVSFLSI